MSIPSMDGALSGHGRRSAPSAVRYMTFGFRAIIGPGGDLDAAYDLLAAQVAPGRPVRLVYQTDSGSLWYTIGYDAAIKQTLVADNKAMTAYCDFSVTWRIRPDWRPRNQDVQDATFAAGNTETFAAGNSEVFTAPGATALASAAQPFTIDATGTAGSTLPTLPDTGPIVAVVGPAGGDAGIRVTSSTSYVPDTNGTLVPMYFDLPFNLPAASDSATLDFGAQAFTHNNLPFRPAKPNYQREYMVVQPGVVNSYVLSALGANPLHGGYVARFWWRKKA